MEIKGKDIVIPGGTTIHDFNLKHGRSTTVSKRKQTVRLAYVSPGYTDFDHGEKYTVPDKVTWAGSSGYWRDAEVSEAMCEANPWLTEALRAQRDRWSRP